MRNVLAVFLLACGLAQAQQVISFLATTGDVSLSSAGTKATIQQPATGGGQIVLDQVVVYCSVSCDVTQTANGTAASTTAGTVTPRLPTPLNITVPVNFYTASNVGSGTAQAGILHLTAGNSVICLSTVCGAGRDTAFGPSTTGTNYTVVIASLTGTVNITFYGRAIN